MLFFQIPGNIKQQFLPFVLNPNAQMTKSVTSSPDLKSQCDPQYFTYKNQQRYMWSGSGRLNFYPTSLDSLKINDDISFKLLYGRDPTTFKMTNSSIGIADLLNTIPGVQIREFLPDTRLDQCINMFMDLFKNMTKLFTKDDSNTNSSTKDQVANKTSKDDEVGIFKKISAVAWYTVKYMVGAVDPNFFTQIKVNDVSMANYNQNLVGSNLGCYVMRFPYIMYYRLQSCVTTGIYEVPAVPSSKSILHGGGSAGWGSGSDFMSSGGFRISGLLGKIPLIGDIANMILGNIGIHYTPWWNAEAGSQTQEPQVELTFDLFNDNSNAAMMNFIFVNTIVPNNRWIQYNMFQHSSHIYDVKIEGINRLYACRGDIDVTYEGILRDPPAEWIDILVSQYGNKNAIDPKKMAASIKTNRLIKIPDIYRVKMTFQSLLPANFNNYIFNYAENNNHIDNYYTKVYDSSAFAEILPNAIKDYTDRIAKVWKTGKEDDVVTKKNYKEED